MFTVEDLRTIDVQFDAPRARDYYIDQCRQDCDCKGDDVVLHQISGRDMPLVAHVGERTVRSRTSGAGWGRELDCFFVQPRDVLRGYSSAEKDGRKRTASVDKYFDKDTDL